MKEEIWKDIEGYEGLYQVSNLGRVRSFLDSGGNVRKVYKILKQGKSKNGYSKVQLSKGKRVIKTYNIHRLVAEAFIPNPENKPQVNHINGIKADNRVENLEWTTAKENQNHSVKAGLKKTGAKSYQAKLTGKQVIEIRKEYESGKFTKTALAEKYGVSRKCIYLIVNEKTYKTE